MRQIYLDNAATSFPKAPGVAEAMLHYIRDIGANINRSTYAQAMDAASIVLDARRRLASLVHFPGPATHVVFTPGATYGLNLILKGSLKSGEHIIVSSLEHNAVMRPLAELGAQGIAVSCIPADRQGRTDARAFTSLIRPATRLALISHASNVSGNVFPLEEIAEICHQRNLPLALDASQSAGHIPIDFAGWNLSALCVPGHKGLLGPQGIGAVLLSEGFANRLRPLVTGGTGSASDSEVQPEWLPDRFEAGTQNVPGIFGLQAALVYLEQRGVRSIAAHEALLTESFLAGLQGLPLRVLGGEAMERVGVVSLNFSAMDNARVAFQLEERYGILTRCGLHCAPAAHRTLGSFPAGSVRFSFGYANTREEVELTLQAIREICKQREL